MSAPTYFGSASNPADNGAANEPGTQAITPPASMTAGQLVVMIGVVQVTPPSTAMAISNAGGQTWSTASTVGANDTAIAVFWCQFNGTWSANPSIVFAAESGTQPTSAIMHVFTPSTVGTWRVDTVFSGSAMSSASPQTITGITPVKRDNVSIAAWFQTNIATWGTLSGTGWVAMSPAQFRNSAGSDISATFAHQLQATAAATNNVSQTPSIATTGVKFTAAWYNDLEPTIALNTADASSFGTGTPTVECTGTDGNADDLRYVVEVDTVNTFDSVAAAIDASYSESNSDNQRVMADSIFGVGTSFTSNGGQLSSAKFYLSKTASPTGNATAKLYKHVGAFAGTGDPPSGSTIEGAALATSNTLDVSTLTTSLAVTELTFATPYALVRGARYFITIEYSGGTATNKVNVGTDSSAPTAAGQLALKDSAGVWSTSGLDDACFYVYAKTPLLNKISGTDSGFANTVTGGDTDPFNSGEKVGFTVQAGNSLADGTYYWRAAARDPNGSGNPSAFATTRSFTISTASGTRGAPFGQRSTAFNGGKTFQGILR